MTRMHQSHKKPVETTQNENPTQDTDPDQKTQPRASTTGLNRVVGEATDAIVG